LESKSFQEIKKASQEFIAAAEAMWDDGNGILVWELCRRFGEAFLDKARPYSATVKKPGKNVVIIKDDAPAMTLAACVPFGRAPQDVIAGLRLFISRCDDYIPPVYDAITEDEMRKALSGAQRMYRFLDIVAPNEPLKILRFDYSHKRFNLQCEIPHGKTQAVIYSIHPKERELYDRVFIFAHELGHALHLALTGSVKTAPDGFEEFNRDIGVELRSLQEMQEAFADSTALAILNARGLRSHFPSDWSKSMSYRHAQYLQGVCAEALRKKGIALDEPLPEPFRPYAKAIKEFEEKWRIYTEDTRGEFLKRAAMDWQSQAARGQRFGETLKERADNASSFFAFAKAWGFAEERNSCVAILLFR
jgi:hypothetical protein